MIPRGEGAVLQELMALLGPGWVWPRFEASQDEESAIQARLRPTAQMLDTVEVRAAELMDEVDPRTAVQFLADFERVLGADPCERAPTTFAERQRIAHQRWIAKGGQSIPYFIEVAAALGVSVTIEEFWPSVAGGLRAGQRLRPRGIEFDWLVRLAPTARFNFFAGSGRAGQRLGWFALSNIECVFQRLKPAHTQVHFRYVGSI